MVKVENNGVDGQEEEEDEEVDGGDGERLGSNEDPRVRLFGTFWNRPLPNVTTVGGEPFEVVATQT